MTALTKGTVKFLMPPHTTAGIVAEVYLYYTAIFPSSLHLKVSENIRLYIFSNLAL